MLCQQARIRLADCKWQDALYGQDVELLEHLSSCHNCSSLLRAEQAINQHLAVVRRTVPASELSVSVLRTKIESTDKRSSQTNALQRLIDAFIPNTRFRIAAATVLAAFAVIALIPLNFNQKIGYQIAIDGVERDIALENPKITSLLGALGMEQEEATSLLDSLGMNQIHFTVGECSETCRLTIFDLKTERDVNLMVQAIIDLGCCRIDNIAPVFRNESMSLLGLATRKLLS